MNLKLLTMSIAVSSILMAVVPMVPTSMSTDNGGTKLAVDAYSDGGGVLIINQAADTKLNNSSMNSLVFKYGEIAKSSNTTLKNQISVLSTESTSIEKIAASSTLEVARIVINPPANGSSCDDGNPATTGETWLNNVCQGGSGAAENIAGNGLFYDNCEGGSRTWVNAESYCISKGSGWRLPTIAETSQGAAGVNGVPPCPIVNTWSWTSSPTSTYYYVWSNSASGYGFTWGAYPVRCVK